MMQVGVLGLGEAGSLFAADLVAGGVRVVGFDPADVPTPHGVERCAVPADAVRQVDLVLALTAAADARTALVQGLDAMPPGQLYADLSTSAPSLKRELSAVAADHGVEYVDVALVAVVPGHGLRTPALVSGPSADRYAAALSPFDVPIESIGGAVGDAITRKLLRSVMMKGLAAVIGEAMRAAEEADLAEWLWRNIVDEISAADERLVTRLVDGTARHARRRLEEMQASEDLLASLGVEPVMTSATVRSLQHVASGTPQRVAT
jgi:3-hydroxyisobutyrate dehydrogenase-like beta-hydroxyacid dehydrogenase